MKNYFLQAILALVFTVSLPSCVTTSFTTVPPIEYYTKNDSVPLYRTPSTKGSSVKFLPKSTLVHVSGVSKQRGSSDPMYTVSDPEENEWYVVVIDGIRYYVLKKYLMTEAEYFALQERAPAPQPSYSSPTRSSYSSPSRTIQTGPRGGKYYINSNGNKTYIRRK